MRSKLSGPYKQLQGESAALCFCCYIQPHVGQPYYLCTCTPCCLAASACGLLLLLLLSAEIWVGSLAGRAFVARHEGLEPNLTLCEPGAGGGFCGVGRGPVRTPNNMTDTMWFPGCTSSQLVGEMAAFNRNHDWKYVRLEPRPGAAGQEKVLLDAWWLPAADPAAPRVVIAHGRDRNFNDWTVHVPAYMLRSMGFAVLLPNLRGHGSAARAEAGAWVTWGWAYHLDVLGAWDYAVRDPRAELGGPADPGSVGLMGFGLGGLAAAVALGLEPRVPAAWLDSAVFEPSHVLAHELQQAVGRLSGLFARASWLLAQHFAAAELAHRTPAAALAARNRTARRARVAVLAGLRDAVVPPGESRLLAQALRARGELYEVREDYGASAACGAATHAVMQVWRPDAYRAKLCRFWSSAFRRSASDCGLVRLPHFGMDVFAEPGWEERPEALGRLR